LFTTEQAMAECVPYYVDLFHQMRSETHEPAVSVVTAAPLEG
jgi:3beta-hydroxy-Delta5-steroid dehydrogenase / steroid Delta-isomerase